MTLPLDTSNFFTGQSLSFGATGLPSGLTINTSSGVIDGAPDTLGSSAVTVTATNAAGSAQQSFDWTITAAASAPDQVAGVSAIPGDAEIALSWGVPADNGAALTDYLIERDEGAGFAALADGVSVATAFTDTGLSNGTTYTYRISAVNAEGTGPASAPVSATPIPAAVAPAQVTGLVAMPGDAQATLGWNAPADGGSPITDYLIERNDGTGFQTVADGVGAATGFTDTGLVNDTLYSYRVSAINAIGTGPASAVATVTPEASGGVVAAITSFDEASDPSTRVTYSFPAVTVGGGTVFVGVTRRGSSGEDVSIVDLTVGGVSATLIGEQIRQSSSGGSQQIGQRMTMMRLDGVSAGSPDISVVFASSPSRCGIVVWAVENAGAAVFSSAARIDDLPISLTADAPADGLLLAHGMAVTGAPGLSFSSGVDQRMPERQIEASYFDQAGDRAFATAQSGVLVAQAATGVDTTGTNVILTVLSVAPA